MSAGQKHIVLLTSEFTPLPGGIGNHASNLAEYLSKNGYKVSVIADHRGKKEVEKYLKTTGNNFNISYSCC